ncbi:MAG: hypothetical protein KC656_02660 [Myxococcales bacterium]|nr:hypothetical protein [Myxococcales bacterium]
MDFARREMAFACEQGNVKRVRQLLEFGVNVLQEHEHRSYMHRAATYGQYMVIKVLIHAGAVPNHQDLVAAVASGSRHSANYISDGLLETGTSPAEFSWCSVLSKRAFMEQLTPEMARWLVENEVDLEERDVYGRSLAELAESNGSAEVAEIFKNAMAAL